MLSTFSTKKAKKAICEAENPQGSMQRLGLGSVPLPRPTKSKGTFAFNLVPLDKPY